MTASVEKLFNDTPHELNRRLNNAIERAGQAHKQFASLIGHLEKLNILRPIHAKQLEEYTGQNRAFKKKIDKASVLSESLLQDDLKDPAAKLVSEIVLIMKQLNTWTAAIEGHWTKPDPHRGKVTYSDELERERNEG